MKTRHQKRAAILAIIAILQCIAVAGAWAQSPRGDAFNRADWIADYAALKLELERSYSHLTWFGSPQGEVDLPALDRATRTALDRALNDDEAWAAINTFVTAFHDGHFAPTAAPQSSTTGLTEPATVTRAADARTACAAFGYAPLT